MTQSISGNPRVTYINDNNISKVRDKDITFLGKKIEKVKNSYQKLKSNRSVTGRFEVNYSNIGQIKTFSDKLIGFKKEAVTNFNHIKKDEYKEKYRQNKRKLNTLKSLHSKAYNLKIKIDEKIKEFERKQHDADIAWKNSNDPALLKREDDKKAQRQEDARKGNFSGGMIK